VNSTASLAAAIGNQDRRALAQAITLVESGLKEHQAQAHELLSKLPACGQSSLRIGITGPPGAGKSTFIESLGGHMIDRGHSLAVLTVDPSSVISGGSILGDKTRMPQLSASDKAFIRPSPSSGIEGGVGRFTREAIALCEAGGFDRVIVETVGVGQSELRAAQMTDLFVLLLVPGSGDQLQGIKRGVMELADLILVNKSDGDLEQAANRTVSEYATATGFLQARTPGWKVPVLGMSALDNVGVEEALDQMEDFFAYVNDAAVLASRREVQASDAMMQALHEGLLEQFLKNPDIASEVERVRLDVVKGRMTSGLAARQLIDQFTEDRGNS
jgi:LAO/AO transport system kinase|tara:strand:- start:23666 stop:24655 length:990 start_codon:yes stop_codon:yes gene_type:complete